MYFNGTKCQLLLFSCLLSVSLFAKDVKTINAEGLRKPLCFVENKGQVMDENNHFRSDIQFKLASNGMNLYVGNGQLHYQFRKVDARKNAPLITSYNVDVALVGANTQAKATATDKLDYFENYYLAQTGTQGFSVNAYNKITYTNVYPNIDWVLYLNDGKVEYDFVIRPGGNPKDIKLKYTGATDLAITKYGGIIAKTPMGDITEDKLYAFETKTGKKVASKYVLHDHILSFETGDYTGSLTIDPYILWSTYLGGNGEDVATSVKCSAGGNVYVTGYTASNNFPTSALAGNTLFQATFGTGTYDAFLTKYNSAGAIQFSTYFGGTGDDMGMGVALDNAGTGVYLVGSTTTTGTALAFPVATAFQNTNAGLSDLFLVKFNQTGARQWSTYAGGIDNDYGYSVICDLTAASGNVFIAGSTASTAISTDGTFLNGVQDGYIAKFSTAGVNQWVSYYGGEGSDEIDAIGINTTSFLTITGQTNSTTGMATNGAVQSVMDGTDDAFAAYFKTTGAAPALIWGTYIGGSGEEKGNAIASDALNNIYIAGSTTSADSIAGGISYTSTYGGSGDAFLTKFDATGVQKWGTYFGGSDTDAAKGVCVDAYGNITIAGGTSSVGVASTGAFQVANAGSSDAFVAKYNTLGQKMYSTYYGKTGYDYANAIIPDAAAATTSGIIIVGFTNSTGINSSGGVAQPAYGGGSTDGFVTKFLRDTVVAFRQRFQDTILCPGGSFVVHDTVNLNFAAGNIFRVQLSDASGSFAAPVVIGSSTTTLTGPINVTIPAGTPVGSGYRIRIVSTAPVTTSVDDNININILAALPSFTPGANTPVCVGLPLNLTANPPFAVSSYSWSGPPAFSSALQNPTIAAVTAANAGVYSVTVVHTGCPASTNTVTVVVNSFIPPAPVDSASSPICQGSDLYLFTRSTSTTGTYTYSWTGPAGFTSTSQNPVIPAITPAQAGTYFAIDTLDGCPSLPTGINIVIQPTDTPNITITVSPNDTVCAGTLVHFSTTVTNGGFSPGYQWILGSSTLVVGAIFDNYASAFFSSGTGVRCILTPGTGCHDKPYDTSNVILMTVYDNTPAVSIIALPDTVVASGTTVTFNGYASGPSIVGYQWYVNNSAIAGATSTTLVLPSVTHNDTVRLEVASIANCANIGVSNRIVIHIPTGVANVSPSFQDIELFPNPNNGAFLVKGNLMGIQDGTVSFDVTNALGQVVYTSNTTIQNGSVDKSFDLKNMPTGMYMLRINKDGEGKVFRFMIE